MTSIQRVMSAVLMITVIAFVLTMLPGDVMAQVTGDTDTNVDNATACQYQIKADCKAGCGENERAIEASGCGEGQLCCQDVGAGTDGSDGTDGGDGGTGGSCGIPCMGSCVSASAVFNNPDAYSQNYNSIDCGDNQVCVVDTDFCTDPGTCSPATGTSGEGELVFENSDGDTFCGSGTTGCWIASTCN